MSIGDQFSVVLHWSQIRECRPISGFTIESVRDLLLEYI